jgi:hypothetical protein
MSRSDIRTRTRSCPKTRGNTLFHDEDSAVLGVDLIYDGRMSSLQAHDRSNSSRQQASLALHAINTFQLRNVNKQLSNLSGAIQSLTRDTAKISDTLTQHLQIAQREELYKNISRATKHCIFVMRQTLEEVAQKEDKATQIIMLGEINLAMNSKSINAENLEEVSDKEMLAEALKEIDRTWKTIADSLSETEKEDIEKYYELACLSEELDERRIEAENQYKYLQEKIRGIDSEKENLDSSGKVVSPEDTKNMQNYPRSIGWSLVIALVVIGYMSKDIDPRSALPVNPSFLMYSVAGIGALFLLIFNNRIANFENEKAMRPLVRKKAAIDIQIKDCQLILDTVNLDIKEWLNAASHLISRKPEMETWIESRRPSI